MLKRYNACSCEERAFLFVVFWLSNYIIVRRIIVLQKWYTKKRKERKMGIICITKEREDSMHGLRSFVDFFHIDLY